MIEIRIHGRGGQGTVTVAELLASAAYFDGKYSQAFPFFGVERRGAPVASYARIDDKFIRLRSQIIEPEYIIIQDASLINEIDVFAGAKKGTVVLLNSKDDQNIKTPSKIKLTVIRADEIGQEIIGKPFPNTVLLGAFAALSGLVNLKSVEKAIKNQWSDKDIADKNIKASEEGYKIILNSPNSPNS